MQPLHAAASGKPNEEIYRTAERDQAFNEARTVLRHTAKLTYLSPGTRLILTTDTAAGAVLEQVEKEGRRPLGFFLKTFSSAEKNYLTFDRELTAIFKAWKHFQFILVGRKVRIVTDHKPLITALHKQTDAMSVCQQRQLGLILQFVDKIEHMDGELNSGRFAIQTTTDVRNRSRH